jgi:hypothetical protein
MTDTAEGFQQYAARRFQELGETQDVLKRMMTALEHLLDVDTTPKVTVRHYQSPEGWQYETTVMLRPETIASLPNTLAWVDETARAEASKRTAQDALDRAGIERPRT